MGYLDESQYLGDAPQAPMQLADQLAGEIVPDPGGVLPADLVRLPGGIVMKKTTAVILGIAIVLVLVYWCTNKNKKRK